VVSQIATGARQLAPIYLDHRAYRKAWLIVLAKVPPPLAQLSSPLLPAPLSLTRPSLPLPSPPRLSSILMHRPQPVLHLWLRPVRRHQHRLVRRHRHPLVRRHRPQLMRGHQPLLMRRLRRHLMLHQRHRQQLVCCHRLWFVQRHRPRHRHRLLRRQLLPSPPPLSLPLLLLPSLPLPYRVPQLPILLLPPLPLLLLTWPSPTLPSTILPAPILPPLWLLSSPAQSPQHTRPLPAFLLLAVSRWAQSSSRPRSLCWLPMRIRAASAPPSCRRPRYQRRQRGCQQYRRR